MAYEADKVVVELVAKVDQFDQPVTQSASKFDTSMNKISASAGKGEKAIKSMTAEQFRAVQGVEAFARATDKLSAPVDRMGRSARQVQQQMRNLGFQIGDIGTQLSSGTSPFIVLAQQGPQVANAVAGAGGAVGKFASFLSGPWGAAILAGTTLLGMFLLKHKQTAEGVDDLVQKLKEHYEQTKLSTEAHKAFDATIEGSIAKIDEMTAALKKQNLTFEDNIALMKAAAATALQNVVTNIAAVSGELAAAVRKYQAAKDQLADIENGNFGSSTEAASATAAAQVQVRSARSDVLALVEQLNSLSTAANQGANALHQVDFPLFERNAKDAVDPVAAINHKFDDMAAAAKNAGTYTQALASDIERQRKAALDAAKATDKLKNSNGAIADFKASVIGAEGTGPNKLGSSAAGFGQFMPSTWLSYFDKLFPDKADLDTAAKLEFRNVREVATAVIDAATNDYVSILKHAGQQITAANLYAVHLLGAGDAKKLLTAAPGTPTSSFLSPQVLKGNPFLQGTASSALSAIGQRIGDSSSAVSSGAAALQKILDAQEASWQRLGDQIAREADKEDEVTVAKEAQLNYVEEFNRQGGITLEQLVQHIADVTGLTRQYEQLVDSQKELNQFGEQLIDDVLNPDNWKNWGDAAQNILHEIEMELFKLAAINPLKNLLLGQNNPTLSSIFSLFGGGGGVSLDLSDSTAAINSMLGFGGPRAGGGPVSAGKTYLVGENGPELFKPGSSGVIIPNDRATPAGAGMGGGSVIIGIEASEYFDGRVLSVTGPVMARVGVRAADGGAVIARRNLGREQQHRLEQ